MVLAKEWIKELVRRKKRSLSLTDRLARRMNNALDRKVSAEQFYPKQHLIKAKSVKHRRGVIVQKIADESVKSKREQDFSLFGKDIGFLVKNSPVEVSKDVVHTNRADMPDSFRREKPVR